MTPPGGAHGRSGSVLDWLCRALAIAGGALLGGLALLVVASVVGRACCNAPLQGDYELAQIAVAVAVSLCLPWCQWRRGHVAVDFFTAQLPPRRQIRLDAGAAFILALVCTLLAWRAAVGAVDMQAVGETTMIVGFPLWIGYAAMLPGLVGAALAGFVAAAHDWRQSYRWQ